MAIAYGSQGAGASTATNGASLDLVCPATVNANDILIAHVMMEGLTNAPSTPSGWTLLYGPVNVGDATATGRAWVFGDLAIGSEDGATVGFGSHANTSGRHGRIYSFTGYVSGALEDLFSSWVDDPSETTIPLPQVTTQTTGALAVALLVQDDNNAFAAGGAVTGGTWAEAVAEYVSTIGAQGAVLGVQTSTPTGNPGTIIGGTANATADEGSTIGFSLHDTAQTIITARSSMDSVDTPKTVIFAGCDSGDRLLVIAGGNKTSGANAPTDCTTTTTAGSTNAWVEIVEGLNNSGTSAWFSSASTDVTGAGEITVNVARAQPATTQPWGFAAYRLRGYSAVGTSNSQGDGAGEILSLTVSTNSFVAVATFDWDNLVGTGYDPSSGATEVSKFQLAAPTMAITNVFWTGQAAGTRNYGTTGSAGTSISIVAVEVLVAVVEQRPTIPYVAPNAAVQQASAW